MKRPLLLALLFVIAAAFAFGDDAPLFPQPVVLANDLPDVAECHGILRQEIVDLVRAAQEDPHDTFERWRQEKRSMMEESPVIECQSALWKALRHLQSGLASTNAVTVPSGTAGFNLRSDDTASQFAYQVLTASVGANVEPAGGVEAYQGEMQIAVNPNNPLQMVAGANSFYRDPSTACLSPTGGSANTYGTQALYGSSDGGATWTYKCAPWPSSLTGGVTGAAAWFGSDPAMAWDSQGRAYAVYMLISQNSAGTSAGSAIVIARSTDSGQTWSNLGTIVNNINVSSPFHDKEFVAVDNGPGPSSTKSHPGRIYVIWDADNVERVAYSDNGTSWTTVVLPTASVGSYDIGGDVKVAPDGTVYAIWNRLVYSGSTQSGERTVFSKSVDGGATWTTPIVIASQALLSFGTNNKPPAQESRGVNAFGSLGIDTNSSSAYNSYLYFVYPDFPSGTTTGTNINIYLVRSTNGGTSWSTPVKVNDDSGTATQIFPWLAVDPTDGSVNVSWYDTRADSTNNRKSQFFYARSVDGGNTFESNILVTDNGGTVWRNGVNYSDENTTDNSGRNANQYGDYSGIIANNRKVVPFWTDSRPYFPTADTVSPSRKEDAAAAIIVNCSAPDAVAAPVVTIDPSCSTPSVTIDWSAPGAWGTNATSGTYSVYRSTSSTFPTGSSPLASSLSATTYVDTTGLVGVTYYYFVTTKNNCPGTALTPMSANSTASNAVVFPACGLTFGNIAGTVQTSGGSPISGATITAGTRSTTSDGSGAYTLLSLPTGTYNVTASATGYNSSTVNNVVVADGVTTTQNFTLAVQASSSCFTDTTQADFQAGTATNVDLTTSAGDVKLALSGSQAIDQQNTTLSTSGNGVTTTTWEAQTFTAGANGSLTRLDVAMFCSSCSGTTPNLTVDIRTVSGGVPTSTILATTTINGFSSGATAYYTATFSSPATIVSGTSYAYVVRLAANPSAGTYATTRSSNNPYSGGAWSQSVDSGANWSAQGQDLGFKVYITPNTYQTSGNLVSSVKDSAPVTGATTTWTTLSWTSVSPASTTVKFQAAGSNSSSGPFSFVGPDGTASTFFTTSGASLSQFNGLRYLKYKAYLSTTNTAATPTLNSVVVCDDISESVTTALSVSAASGTYGGTAALSATLTANGSPLSGETITFTLNGSSFAGNTATTDVNGTATIASATLAGINAGSYPTGVGASFAGSGSNGAASSTASLTISKATPTVSVSGGTYTYDANPHAATGSVTGVGGANLGTPTFTYTPGGATAPTNAGSYDVSASFAGNTNYNAASAPSNATITINKATPTVSVTGGTFTYDTNPHAATGSVTGVGGANLGTPTFTYTPGGSTAPTNAGSYSVDGSFAGNANYNSASSASSATITINKATPTVNVTGGTFTYDTNPHAASATVTGVGGANLGAASITYTPGGATVPVNAGSYSVSASYGGDTNYNSAIGSGTITIDKATPIVTATGGTFTYDANPHPASATVTGVGGADLGAATITYAPGGATVPVNAGSYTATASFAGNTNYNSANDNATITIGKATPVLTATGGTFTYDGNPHAASATVTGVGGADLGAATITYTPGGATVPVNAGSYTATASFAATTNYTAASDNTTITIDKATPIVTVTGGTYTYDGNAHAATGTITGVNAENLGTPAFTYTPGGSTAPTNAGSYSVDASFAGNTNYNAASSATSATITIDKATPIVTVTGGTYTYDGNAHNATGTVTGVNAEDLGTPAFTYDPATPIDAGTYTATASFAGNTNYNAASSATSATITINKANATVVAVGGTFTYDGNAHNATATVTGVNSEDLGSTTITYDPATPVNAGTYTATASFAGNTNYNAASDQATITIGKATPIVSVTGGTFTYDGNAHTATASATGVNGEDLGSVNITYTPSTPLNAGSYTANASFAGNTNYDAGANSANITINKATPLVTVTGGTFPYDGNPHAATATVTGIGGADLGPATITYSPGGATAPTSAGTYDVTASFAGDANYDADEDTTTITISKSAATINVIGGTFIYDGNAHVATATATGNHGEDLGAVTITYTPGGATPPTGAGSYLVTVTFAGDANYDATSGDGSITIDKATPIVTVTGGTYTYDGNAHNATTSVTGVNGEDLGSATITYDPATPVNAGTYTASASFAGNTNYNAASSATSATITIDKATPIVTVTGGTYTYDGNAHNATASVTGVNGENLGSATITYDPTTPINAGTYTASASFAGNTNYNAASSATSATITIDKANATVVATGGTFTYDGNAHTATATVTGVNSEDLGSATITYDPATPVNAGTYTATASFAGNTNYNAASDQATITIDKATPIVSVTGGTFTYDGNAHTATASATGVNGEDLGSVNITYTPSTPLNAGSYTANASFAGNTNYEAGANSASITINKATPTVTVTGGTFPYDGNAHNATASATGVNGEDLGAVTIAYDPGTPINAGTYTATGSFAGDTNYNAASNEATITISKSAATINVIGGTFTYDGTAHAATATATGNHGEDLGAVTITYTPGGATAPTDAGSYLVTASFAGDANYDATSGDGSITIDKATPTVSVTGGTFTYDGNAHAATGSVTGVNAEDLGTPAFTYTPGGATAPTHAGAYDVSASFAGNTNYNSASSATSATITINKASATVVATGGTFTYDGNAHTATATVTGVNGEDLGSATITYDPATPVNAGTYTATASFAGNTNYNAASDQATITIGKATPTVSITGGTFTYDGNAHTATASATGVNGEDLGSVTITYDPATPVNAGSYTANASFAGNTNYEASANSASITINKATPTVVATGGSFTYDGNAHNATATVTGVNGEDLGSATITYDPSTPLNAGTYTATASFAGNTNYNAASDQATITINKANATVVATGGTYTYDGNAHTATATVTGVNGEDLGGASITYDPATPINAGTYTATASFAGNTNYNAASDDATITIGKATPIVSVTGGTFAYDGNAHNATASATGVNGEDLGSVNVTYTPSTPLNAGSYTANASFAGNTNYNAGANSAGITITKATPTVTATGGTFTYDGNAHAATGSATGVNAENLGSVTITYTPGGATAPTNAGSYSATASFAGNTNYNAASSSAATITINKATPTVTATGGTFTYDGNPHAASGSVTGIGGANLGTPTFTYTPGGATAPTNAGAYSVTGSFAGNTNYNTASSSAATITINKATPTVTATGGTFTYDGNAHAASGSVTGIGGASIGSVTFTYTPGGATAPTNAGSYSATASFAGNTNYNAASSSAVTITINKATPLVTVTGGSFVYDGNPHPATGAVTGVNSESLGTPTFTYDGSSTVPSALGVYNVIGSYAGNTNYVSGSNTATLTIHTASGCTTTIATPTATNGGPYCAGATVTLTTPVVSGATYAWSGPNGFTSTLREPTITNAQASATGTYSVIVTVGSCSSAAGSTTVTVNALPSTPTISTTQSTSFCTGGSVTLTSSSTTGNQWYRNGSLLSGQTAQTYVATTTGDYTVVVTNGNGCISSASAAKSVLVTTPPSATISVSATMAAGASGTASVADAGSGATYNWSITNGTITAGTGTRSITFTAGSAGTLTLGVTVTNGGGCSDTKSANVTVTAVAASMSVTNVSPANGPWLGGTPVTITGTGFLSGASVTFGGTAATSVVVVNATTITAATPAHASGAVDVTVTNTNATNATLTAGFTYRPKRFDPNGDDVVDPADIFYLVNYLFTHGPDPHGESGMLSGDANGDDTVDPADIFYAVNYLFTGGPAPVSTSTAPAVSTNATATIAGAVTLGRPSMRNGHVIVPVLVASRGEVAPYALAMKLHFDRATTATIHRAGTLRDADPKFEITRSGESELSYLLALDRPLADDHATVVAEVEIEGMDAVTLSLDADVTLLGDESGTRTATAARHTLELGTARWNGGHEPGDERRSGRH